MRFIKVFLIASGILIIYSNTLGPFNPYIKAAFNKQIPELILVLGGDIKREKQGIKIAKKLGLPLLISGGSNREYAEWLIEKEGLKRTSVKLDYRAKDTLSNFTSIVEDLIDNEVTHLLMITSEDHFKRANIIGKIILGSRGIKLTSISIDCHDKCQKESYRKQILDSIRAISWISTGKDPKIIYQKILNGS